MVNLNDIKMRSFFEQYQLYYRYDEKYKLLINAYNTSHSDIEKTVFICLISHEQEKWDTDNHANLDFTEKRLIEYARDNPSLWWCNLALSLINLDKNKMDRISCENTVSMLESVKAYFDKETPSFVLFFLAHAYYALGKVQNSIESNEIFLVKAENEIEALCSQYQSFIREHSKYWAMIMNFRGNLAKRKASITNSVAEENIPYTHDENYQSLDEKAKYYYNLSKDIDSEFEFPYNGLGNIYREQRNYKEAIECYSNALRINCEFMYPWNFIGDCFRMLEEYDIALKCYDKALQCCTHNDSRKFIPLYGIGRVYYELGNRNNFLDKYIRRAEMYFSKAEAYIDNDLPQAR